MLLMNTMLPCRCHMLHCTPSECWQVQPRWSTPCWCQFKYSTHICEGLSSSFRKTDSSSLPQEVTVHMQTGWVGCHHARHFTKSVLVSGASRKLHTWKLDLHITSSFWRGLLWQQKSSASNLAFLSTQVNLYCLGTSCVSRSMAIHLNIRFQLVTNYNSFQNTTVVLLYFQPQSDPLWWSMTLQGRMSRHKLPDNKSLFWSLLSTDKVWAWSFSTPVYQYIMCHFLFWAAVKQ